MLNLVLKIYIVGVSGAYGSAIRARGVQGCLERSEIPRKEREEKAA